MPTIQQINSEVENRCREVDIELARRSLLNFTVYTFEGEYQANWHHRLVADEIDVWLTADEPYNLLVQEPPRHGKSEQCSRRLPGYIFGRNPDAQVLFASYSADLASAMSRDAQRVMLSNSYSQVFPKTRLVTKGHSHDETAIRQANEFTIVRKKGRFRASGVGGGMTGRGADIAIIDDPFKNRQDAESETVREGVIEWYKSTFRTRLEKGGRILMLLTRWHVHDLAGWCIDKMKTDPDADTWKVISLPATYEKTEFSHAEDRRKEGEALWLEKYPVKDLRKIKASIGTYDWNALFQQRPSPPGGAVFKREWAQVIDTEDLPPNIRWVRCWDLAVTAKTSADYTASVQLGVDSNMNVYCRKFVRDQVEWPVGKKMIKAIAKQEKVAVGVTTTGMQKGFFQDLMSDLEMLDVPLYAFNEDTDKLTRALPWIARAEAGKFYLVRGKGVDIYIDELVEFTGQGDKHDDQCLIAGTKIRVENGTKNIENVKVGDLVMTTLGLRKVLNAGLTQKKAQVCRLCAANGVELTGTGNHPIFTKKGYVALDTMSGDDIIMLWKKKRLYLTAKHIIGIPRLSREHIGFITGIIRNGKKRLYHFIEQYGKAKMVKYLKDASFTILMKTRSIMTLKIFDLCSAENTPHIIQREFVRIDKKHIWKLLGGKPKLGINQMQDENGIESMQKQVLREQEPKEKKKYVLNAGKNLKVSHTRNIAHVYVVKGLVFASRAISLFVNFARKSFSHLRKRPNFVPERVIMVTEAGQADVYNLTVEESHNFIANGILVHNCDATSGAYRMLAEYIEPEVYVVGQYG